MQLLIGLLILLILIGQIYKIINDRSVEFFDIDKRSKGQSRYWDKTIRHYKSLGNKKFQNTVTEIAYNEEIDNFVRLDSNNNLIETFEANRIDTEEQIDRCRSLKKCGELESNPKCGYCGSSGKFDYNKGGDIAPDICPLDKEDNRGNNNLRPSRGNTWASNKDDCIKIRDQKICDKVSDCGGLNNPETKNLCAWCPSDDFAKVKTRGPNALLLYDGDDAGSKITGDVCTGLNKPDADGDILFTKLQKAGSCSVCQKKGSDGSNTGASGPHTKECLDSLWATPYREEDYTVACSTETSGSGSNERNGGEIKITGHENASIGNNIGSYLKVAHNMKTHQKEKILKFKREYDELNMGYDRWSSKSGEYRRDYGKGEINKRWNICFNKPLIEPE